MNENELFNAASIIAAAIVIAGGAIGSGLGIGNVAAKYIEGAARQPELAKDLQVRTMVIAGFLDSLPIISIGIGLLILFVNPMAPST
ncbi:F0F1 ATP synthase subunit C [Aliikangiella coralliicola]|uniref:ATP synthase subunit c n=2 Tax=Aliikangiella coralliicola TaxID=2592383 RepID=A0A545UGU5_9GAMM|nr:F0F1 ATP synthase subunit C [Aliikangiella coralliicola]TQV88675.1 F0F1 ATP synthase subunit C [Aliikangiella coralliicola]